MGRAFLVALAALYLSASKPPLEERTYGGWVLRESPPDSGSARDLFRATLYGPDAGVVASFDDVPMRHAHPFEVHGQEVFWLVRVGDYTKDEHWTDELWVESLQHPKPERLIAYPGIDFLAAPDGNTLALDRDNTVVIFDRRPRRETVIATPDAGGRNDGYTLLAWSGDGRTFWLGAGTVAGWSQLGVWQNGSLRWLRVASVSEDEALNADEGLLVTSDAPFAFDVESEEALSASSETRRLQVTDMYTGNSALVAKAGQRRFSPVWLNAKTLRYEVDGKRTRVNVRALRALLAH